MSSSREKKAKLTKNQIGSLRLQKSGLLEPFETVNDCLLNLVGVQAQVPSCAAVSIFLRSPLQNFAAFESELYRTKSIIRIWGQRRTLHVYSLTDWPLIVSAFRNRPSWWLQKAIKRGDDLKEYMKSVKRIEKVLMNKGVIDRDDVRGLIDESLLSSWGGVFADIEARGNACHAQPKNGKSRIAHREFWLPNLPWSPPSEQAAQSAIAQRYFEQYGPATIKDFSHWIGLPIRTISRYIYENANLAICEYQGREIILHHHDLEALSPNSPPTPELIMVYKYDPILLSYKDKSWIIDPVYANRVWREAAIVEGVVIMRGQITGTWNYSIKSQKTYFTIHMFRQLNAQHETRIAHICNSITRFFALKLANIEIVQ